MHKRHCKNREGLGSMNVFGDISLQQLEIFLSVAESESITAASRRLFISQSAASRLIQKLESEVGTALLDRNNRGVHLTDAGEQLYRQVKLCYTKLTSALYNANQADGGAVRIACLDATEPLDELAPLLRQFENMYPDIKVDVKVCSHPTLRESILSGACDCAFTYSAACGGLSGVEMRFYKKMDTFFAVSSDCPAIDGDHLDYARLSQSHLYIHLVARQDYTGSRDLSICRAHGFTPAGIQYLTENSAIAGMVMDTNGLAISGKAFGLEFGDAIRRFKVEKPLEEEQYVGVLWRPDDASQEARRFVESVPYLRAERLSEK